MSFTYDPTTYRGQTRLLITDTDATNIIFQDDEIDAFLGMHDDEVMLAAAQALDVIASSEALVQKRIKLLDLTTDGPAVAEALRAHAAVLRDQVGSRATLDWAEIAVDPFSARDIIEKGAIRRG